MPIPADVVNRFREEYRDLAGAIEAVAARSKEVSALGGANAQAFTDYFTTAATGLGFTQAEFGSAVTFANVLAAMIDNPSVAQTIPAFQRTNLYTVR